MSFSTSPEFFINMKSIPTEDSREYQDFFQNERNKIDYGVTINGVFIHGWLYYHLNHWHIYKDVEDEVNFSIKRKFERPDARDNEWIIAENLAAAEKDKQGLLIFGSRRLGKSEFEASYIGRHATIYEGSENVITGGNWSDIGIIASKVDKGLQNMHPYFRFPRMNNDWRKEVSLGFKDKKGNRFEWSKILIRNFDNGLNTEAVAGITASSFLLDECGKFNWLECFDAAKPAFTSTFGWRVVPIVTGTSGMLSPNTDAEKVFNNPRAYNFREVVLKDEGKKTAIFIPGTRRMESKYKTTFGDFIQKENGLLLPEQSELFQIPFYDSDLEKGKKIIEDEVKQAELSPDKTAVLKLRMYFPQNTTELFLSDSDENPFPVEALKSHLAYLRHLNKTGEYVKLYRNPNSSKIEYGDSRLRPVTDYPVEKSTLKDAPVVIYEAPLPNPPAYLYIGGADPYNTNQSENSPSLGTVYIYKRVYDPVAGTYQQRIVASYSSRPDTMKEWHETVEMLLELYNATCMTENIGTNFIQYMENKNKGHYLADGYSLAKQINPKSSIGGQPKGLPPTSGVQAHYRNLIISYLTDEIITSNNDPLTGEPIKMMGLTRIDDPMLLVELINYRETEFKKGGGNKKKGNFDRYVAFGHVLIYDEYLEKIAPRIKVVTEEPTPEKKKPSIHSPFIIKSNNSPFGRSKNAFGI